MEGIKNYRYWELQGFKQFQFLISYLLLFAVLTFIYLKKLVTESTLYFHIVKNYSSIYHCIDSTTMA